MEIEQARKPDAGDASRARVTCPACGGRRGRLAHRIWFDCDRCKATGELEAGR